MTERWYWLATPNQTPKRKDASYVQVVLGCGGVFCDVCDWSEDGVRPFCFGRRNKVRKSLKLESRYQKSKQPFLSCKRQDKYKGMKYYDRR